MTTPNELGAAIAQIKARTGWTWAEVATQLGTTPDYARKLAGGAGKFGSAQAGHALRSNVADFERTGAEQRPFQRPQAVRAKGGGSVPAAPRVTPSTRSAFRVKRSAFKGEARDGWAVRVTVPKRATKAGDREDARNAITGAVRSAARGRRRVMFRVTVQDPDDPRRQSTIELGGRGAYNASRVLKGIKAEGNDPLAWLVLQNLDRYELDGITAEDIRAVEIVALP